MAHINSIGAGLFSDMAMNVDASAVPASYDAAGFAAMFGDELAVSGTPTAATDEFVRIQNVREFPAMGTPPNIVNVPTYGQSTSQQIQGQSDAPNLELQINFVGTDWDDTASLLGSSVGDGNQYIFRFAMLNTDPGTDKYATDASGLGTVPNTLWYWLGKIEAFSVQPSLTDANIATVTLSIQSDFYGAFTI